MALTHPRPWHKAADPLPTKGTTEVDRLAAVCERVASSASRTRKVRLLASYLRELDNKDLVRAVSFLCGCPIVQHSETKLSVGWAALRDAGLAVTKWDPETFRLCQRETGDPGEAISLLLTGKTQGLPLPLELAEETYVRLALSRRALGRVALLEQVLERHTPMSIRYFIKCMSGDLRIGLQEKMVEEAVAESTGVPVDAVRGANNKLGDLARVALAARRGELHLIEVRLFHPMDFMLAKPIEAVKDVADPAGWYVEDKYDGIRAQIHRAPGRVRIFTRGMGDTTAAFPEIVEAMSSLGGSAILDGEVLAWKAGRPLPFVVLQQRIARKDVPAELRSAVPVAFLAFDILFRDGCLLADEPIEERRRILEEDLRSAPEVLGVSPLSTVTSAAALDAYFQAARGRGNEGLVLKRPGSRYEAGKRSGAWCKVKRVFATLDVVITAAEQGHGKRATVLSDYTFAVRDGDRFLNVGKAYSGLTDEEIRELTRILRSLALERAGRVLLVRPEVVLEVGFDGVQQSPRHKSGFALRFPRILRWRRDKGAADIDTLDRVREIYQSAMASYC